MSISQTLNAALQQHRAGRLGEAETLYRRVLEQQPYHADALHLLGVIALQVERVGEALDLIGRAIRVNPNIGEYHGNYGVALERLGRLKEAMEHFERAVLLKPVYAEAHSNLAGVLLAHGRLDQAVAHATRAVELRASSPDAYNNLGNALLRVGLVEEAVAMYRRAIAQAPQFSRAWSNLLLSLHYLENVTPQEIFAEHVRWSEQCAARLAPAVAPLPRRELGKRPLRVGYCSPDFRSQSVSFFIEPVLAHHDRKAFEVFCYADVRLRDSATQRLMEYPCQWRDILTMSNDAVAELIRRDEIDILVDLAGHTGAERVLLFAEKLAPVQVTFLGYPDTTGLRTMDFRLTDALADPAGQTDALHTERLVRLETCAWCYRPPADAPQVVGRPSAQTVTFGSFNALPKLTRRMIQTWAEILREVEHARLMIKAHALVSMSARARLADAFAKHGIDRSRIELLGPVASIVEHLSTWGRIDIALDTFPYHGTTTTCEALWMGVPVITLVGEAHVSRVGLSLLSSVGLSELAVKNHGEYARTAIELANDDDRRRELRRSLRGRMSESALRDEAGFTRRLEQAYVQMWRVGR